MAENTIEISIKGLDELQRQLEELPRKVAQKVLKESLQEVGNELALKLFENAPVSDEVRNSPGWLAGHFAASLKVHEDDIAASINVGGRRIDYPRRASGKTIDVPDIIYWLEMGTTGNLKQNPFMSRTWDGFKEEALDHLIKDISDAIEEAVR